MSLSAGNQLKRSPLWLIVHETRWVFVLGAALLMVSNYVVFKNYPHIWSLTIGYKPFFANWISSDVARILRLAFNEVSIILLVRGIFKEKEYVQFAVIVMLIELVLLMPLYFLLRDVWPIINTGMIHHFLFNPFIGVMLIIALLHQKYTHPSP